MRLRALVLTRKRGESVVTPHGVVTVTGAEDGVARLVFSFPEETDVMREELQPQTPEMAAMLAAFRESSRQWTRSKRDPGRRGR